MRVCNLSYLLGYFYPVFNLRDIAFVVGFFTLVLHLVRIALCLRSRSQYAQWKEECRKMFPVIGSGRYITAPVITEVGQPILDPIVLLETNPDGLTATPDGSSLVSPSSNIPPVKDKIIIEWMLTLHQIGWYLKS